MNKQDMEDLLRQAFNDVVRALVAAEESRSGSIPGHSERVATLAVAIGNEMGLGEPSLVELRRASALHDVGKIAVDSDVAAKLGKLTEPELSRMRMHPVLAEGILARVKGLEGVMSHIRHHHERWDGNGYPDGLRGEHIPLGARIIAVAETFDILTTPLEWRTTMDEAEAADEIGRCAGSQFDPEVVNAFFAILPTISFLRTEAGDV